MALYKCKVIDEFGKKHIIKYDSFSKEETIDYIKNKNYIIIEVKQIKNNMDLKIAFRKLNKIKSKDLYIFCKQLHSTLKAGITIVKSIELLNLQMKNKRFKAIIDQLYNELLIGNTFSQALSNHKDVFPLIFISMVEAGEISGNIDIVMSRLSSHYEKEYKIENKVKSAMIYPIILAIVSSAVVIFLLISVMPTFVGLYSDSGVPLPFATVILLDVSEIIKKLWYLIIFLLVIVFLGISKLKKVRSVRYKIDYYKLRVPIYNNMVLKIAITRFTRTLSILMSSGVALLRALETASKVTGNAYIGQSILNAKEDVGKGLSLSKSLKSQNIFPITLYSMIKIGEDSGCIDEILDKAANYYDEEVDTAIHKLITMLEPIMIVLMAAIIGFIVLAMVTPMFDMIRIVQ